MLEHSFQCPYCWTEVSMLLDLSGGYRQSYIEDCENCCNPIEVRFLTDGENLLEFEAGQEG